MSVGASAILSPLASERPIMIAGSAAGRDSCSTTGDAGRGPALQRADHPARRRAPGADHLRQPVRRSGHGDRREPLREARDRRADVGRSGAAVSLRDVSRRADTPTRGSVDRGAMPTRRTSMFTSRSFCAARSTSPASWPGWPTFCSPAPGGVYTLPRAARRYRAAALRFLGRVGRVYSSSRIGRGIRAG